jgi:hypothetical protein
MYATGTSRVTISADIATRGTRVSVTPHSCLGLTYISGTARAHVPSHSGHLASPSYPAHPWTPLNIFTDWPLLPIMDAYTLTRVNRITYCHAATSTCRHALPLFFSSPSEYTFVRVTGSPGLNSVAVTLMSNGVRLNDRAFYIEHAVSPGSSKSCVTWELGVSPYFLQERHVFPIQTRSMMSLCISRDFAATLKTAASSHARYIKLTNPLTCPLSSHPSFPTR